MRNWEFYLAVVRRPCARPSAACRFNGLVYAKDACESSLLMRPWWPPAPSYAPKYTHGEGAGRKARGIVGSERASRRGDVAARRKMANRSGDAQWEYYLTVVAALLTVGGTPSAIVAQFSRAYRHRCARSQALPHAPPRCWRREGAPSIDASSSEAHTWSCRLKAARHWSAERKRYHANNGSAAPEPSRKQASAANRA